MTQTTPLTPEQAINRWLYFGWNYKTILHSWKAPSDITRTEHVPEFLAKVKWSCNFDHMFNKWQIVCDQHDAYGRLVGFYSLLDSENRMALLTWVIENYHDEKPL